MIFSFLLFLAFFTAVGISSWLKSQGTKKDYYLASSSIAPWLVGLSAVATNNSGYMFIGLIGYTYIAGLSSIWLMLGWICGDFVASLFVHKRLHKATENNSEVSYAGVLANWYGESRDGLQRLIGVISLLFLLTYAAAQLVAGSKALHVLLSWPIWSGAVVGAVVVALYCLAGGIRASIWTDAAQSIVMIGAMALLLVVAIASLGGIGGTLDALGQIDGFLNVLPADLPVPGISGWILFTFGWFVAGASVIGQPHVMVRFMALEHSQKMVQARVWYYTWFVVFWAMANGVGMLSRVYLPEVGSFDAELALPTLAQELFSPFFVGMILAGIFAATMSTADSLLLSCSAAITHDIIPHSLEQPWILKLATVLITGIALLIALANNQSVFSMVIMAWSGLGSAFAPLLIAQSLGRRPSQILAIIAITVGFTTALLWRHFGFHNIIFEGVAGIAAGLITLYAVPERALRLSVSQSES